MIVVIGHVGKETDKAIKQVAEGCLVQLSQTCDSNNEDLALTEENHA